MKYKLINNQTKEEHHCDKVTIDGFDYYVTDDKIHFGYVWNTILEQVETMFKEKTFHDNLKGIVATNNPNIDIPKVVDHIEGKALKWFVTADKRKTVFDFGWINIFKAGYNKSQETHPFSKEDMVEFAIYCNLKDDTSVNELLQLWIQIRKEQQPKILYYGN